MRDIKFRVWNSIDKTIIDWMTLCGMPKLLTRTAMGKEKYYELMQHTGYKDKCSAEIYEDDLVLLTNFNYLNYDNEYVGVSGVGRIQFDMAGWRVVFNDELEIDSIDLYEVYHECKVIGNFHQNPELLEV